MKILRSFALLIAIALVAGACGKRPSTEISSPSKPSSVEGIQTASTVQQGTPKVIKSDAEWRKILTPEQYDVLRQAGTETPGTGKLLNEHRKGTFVCAACANPLFASDTKFESGTGWPSFWKPLPGAVEERSDNSIGSERTEVLCAHCGGHLGHVFDDGPAPTGLRYCMNSVAMNFIPAK